MWRSDDPEDIVAQVHEILRNYEGYEAIRERGEKLARSVFSPAVYATRVLSALSRIGSLE